MGRSDAQHLVDIGQSLVQFLEISHERVQGRGVSVESDTFQHSVFYLYLLYRKITGKFGKERLSAD